MRACIALLLLLPLVPRTGRAQEFVPMLDSIGRGCCTLRVKAPEGSAQGKFLDRPAPGQLLLRPCKGSLCPSTEASLAPVVIPPGAQVEMYAGRHAGVGALWGALVGAVALSALWLGDQDIDAQVGEKLAVGIPVGAIVGGGVGALIGALFPRWKPVRM